MRGHTSSPLFQNYWYWICKHIKCVISLDFAKKSQEVLKFIVGVGVVNDHTNVVYALSTTTDTFTWSQRPTRTWAQYLREIENLFIRGPGFLTNLKGSQNFATLSLKAVRLRDVRELGFLRYSIASAAIARSGSSWWLGKRTCLSHHEGSELNFQRKTGNSVNRRSRLVKFQQHFKIICRNSFNWIFF